jgi:hypothetical protein
MTYKVEKTINGRESKIEVDQWQRRKAGRNSDAAFRKNIQN